jgi:hypothetical protein
MSGDDLISAALEAMEANKARQLEQARAEIERTIAADMAELHRLAAKYNLRVISADTAEAAQQHTATAPNNNSPESSGQSAPTGGVETLGKLAQLYRTDERSPYRGLRFHVRNSTDNFLDRIVKEHADLRLADLNADSIKKLYDQWAADGKLSSGHAFATKLRGLFGFGTTVLDDPGCVRLSTIMNRMRFPNPPARTERLTAEHVIAIRAKAHEMGKPSIALAQAMQFELLLTQKDTIGDWVPVTEPGTSDIVLDGNKWLYGIRWEEIDDNLILRHHTSFANKKLELDLKRAPMVLEELQRLPSTPKKGAVIISEWNQKPWSPNEFRRWWRKVADAVGIPKTIKNMDSSRAADRRPNNNETKATTHEPELILDPDKEVRLH